MGRQNEIDIGRTVYLTAGRDCRAHSRSNGRFSPPSRARHHETVCDGYRRSMAVFCFGDAGKDMGEE